MLSAPGPKPSSRLLRRAFAASVAAHVLFALVLPRQTLDQTSGAARIETITVAAVARISVRRRSQPIRTTIAPKRDRRRDARPEASAVRTNRPSNVRARPAPPRIASAGKALLPSSSVAMGPQPEGAVAAVAATAKPASVATLPAGTPSPGAPQPSSQAKAETGGVMPFGAAFPEPILDPHVRSELMRRFSTSHATLTITVGDDGRTKTVRIAPPLDAKTETEIRQILAVANWDAAVCGAGISCEAQAVIKL